MGAPARNAADDGDWQDDMSNYNSDFSMPSDDDNDDGDFDDRNADIDMPGRRGGRGGKDGKKDTRPLPPLLARVGGAMEVLPQCHHAFRHAATRRLQHPMARQGPQ